MSSNLTYSIIKENTMTKDKYREICESVGFKPEPCYLCYITMIVFFLFMGLAFEPLIYGLFNFIQFAGQTIKGL